MPGGFIPDFLDEQLTAQLRASMPKPALPAPTLPNYSLPSALPPVAVPAPVRPQTEPGGVQLTPVGGGQVQPSPVMPSTAMPIVGQSAVAATGITGPAQTRTNTSSVDMILKRLLAPGRGRSMLPNYY